MSRAISYATIALAVAPGIAAWVFRTSIDFEWLVFLGTLALLGAILALGRPLPRGLRYGVAGFAALALLGTTGLRMRAMAAIRPFSIWFGTAARMDLVGVNLPVASEGGMTAHAKGKQLIVSVDGSGVILWKAATKSLGEMEDVFGRDPGAEVLLQCDRDLPFVHVGWLAAASVAQGHREVWLAVRKFGWLPDDKALGADMRREHWPDLRLAFPVTPREGPRVRLEAIGWQKVLWPRYRTWEETRPERLRIATGARYHFGGRATDDLAQLATWLRATAPASIEADPQVPLKCVVAVQNEIRKAGHPAAALVLPPPPGEEVRNARVLPYPDGG